MAKIVNLMDRHVRILKTAKNGRLEVTRFYPAGAQTSLQLQSGEREQSLDGVTIQPVKVEITRRPDLMDEDVAYIVDMDTAVSLAENKGRAGLLVPCDPFLVPHLPAYTDAGYAGDFELLPGSLTDDDVVANEIGSGYQIYGYQRLLMIYTNDEALENVRKMELGRSNSRSADQDRLREAVRGYYRLHQRQLEVRLAKLLIKQHEVDVIRNDGTTQSFQLNDADVSRLMIYLDDLMYKATLV